MAKCDHCDGTGEVLEPSRTPEEPGRMIPCANCAERPAANRHPAARWRKHRDALLLAREQIKDAHASALPNAIVTETIRTLDAQIEWADRQIVRFDGAKS